MTTAPNAAPKNAAQIQSKSANVAGIAFVEVLDVRHLDCSIGYGRTLERLHHRNPGGSSRSRRVLDRESNGWMTGYRKLTATRNLRSLIPSRITSKPDATRKRGWGCISASRPARRDVPPKSGSDPLRCKRDLSGHMSPKPISGQCDNRMLLEHYVVVQLRHEMAFCYHSLSYF